MARAWTGGCAALVRALLAGGADPATALEGLVRGSDEREVLEELMAVLAP